MDWKIFLATFTAIFIAELADKTQLVGIGMAAKSGKPFTVWLASVAAYIIVTAVSVILGTVLAKYINPNLIKYCGASVFVVIGMLMFLGKI